LKEIVNIVSGRKGDRYCKQIYAYFGDIFVQIAIRFWANFRQDEFDQLRSYLGEVEGEASSRLRSEQLPDILKPRKLAICSENF
jgi:hypothetical protein